MGWILRVTVPAAESELVASRLWDLHTTGIAEVGPGPDARPGPAAAGGRPAVELLAGFPSEKAARAAGAALARATLNCGSPVKRPLDPTVEPADGRAWADHDRRVELDVAGQRLGLEVGAAFGDGGHPSTRLALSLLTDALAVRPGTTVLDLGTGTAILALAARALGAGPVVAVEHDPEALAVATRNLAAHPELGGGVSLARSLPAAGSFGVIVANLVLGEHRLLAALLPPLLADGGVLVMAGLLTTQEGAARALQPELSLAAQVVHGDWLGLALSRPTAVR